MSSGTKSPSNSLSCPLKSQLVRAEINLGGESDKTVYNVVILRAFLSASRTTLGRSGSPIAMTRCGYCH